MNTLLDILRHIVDNSNLFSPADKERAHQVINDADTDKPGESGSAQGDGEGGEATNA